jgi:hypothetical protein
MKYLILIPLFLQLDVFCQNPINLTDQTMKLGGLGHEYFYFGFHEGDQVQLNFEELKKKGIKEIEIKEFSSGRSIYSDYEVKKISGKQLAIPTTGIYQFRFYNASLGKRIGKISISRIPSESQEGFNSTVYWRTEFDTSYIQKEEQYVIKEEYIPKSIIDNSQIFINSGSNATFKDGKSRVTYQITLPQNTVEWYYEVVAYRNKDALDKTASVFSLLSQLTKAFDNTGVLSYTASALTKAPGDNYCDIYLFQDYQNAKLFEQKLDDQFKHFPIANRKNVKSDIVKLGDGYTNGTYFIGIKNPDSMYGINVRLEVVAITYSKEVGLRTVLVPKVSKNQIPYLVNQSE